MSQEIGGSQVTVAAHPSVSASTQQALTVGTWQIFGHLTSAFRTSFDGSYLAIFVPFAPDGKEIIGGEWSNGRGLSVRENRLLLSRVAYGQFTPLQADSDGDGFDNRVEVNAGAIRWMRPRTHRHNAVGERSGRAPAAAWHVFFQRSHMRTRRVRLFREATISPK
jgi:hypothetical protein